MKVPKKRNPLPYAGAYELHLYCDRSNDAHGYDEFPHQFGGSDLAVCLRTARARGWIVHRDRTATCPRCH